MSKYLTNSYLDILRGGSCKTLHVSLQSVLPRIEVRKKAFQLKFELNSVRISYERVNVESVDFLNRTYRKRKNAPTVHGELHRCLIIIPPLYFFFTAIILGLSFVFPHRKIENDFSMNIGVKRFRHLSDWRGP